MQIRKQDIDDLGPLASLVATNLNTIDAAIDPADRNTIRALKQDPKQMILKAAGIKEDIAQKVVTSNTINNIEPIAAQFIPPKVATNTPPAPISDPNQLEFAFTSEVDQKIYQPITIQDLNKNLEKILEELRIIKINTSHIKKPKNKTDI